MNDDVALYLLNVQIRNCLLTCQVYKTIDTLSMLQLITLPSSGQKNQLSDFIDSELNGAPINKGHASCLSFSVWHDVCAEFDM